jgi:hypothetical protein
MEEVAGKGSWKLLKTKRRGIWDFRTELAEGTEDEEEPQ